jgi:hypothetical protein
VDNGASVTLKASLLAIAPGPADVRAWLSAKAPVIAIANGEAALTLQADPLRIDGLFETAAGRLSITDAPNRCCRWVVTGATTLPDGREFA